MESMKDWPTEKLLRKRDQAQEMASLALSDNDHADAERRFKEAKAISEEIASRR